MGMACPKMWHSQTSPLEIRKCDDQPLNFVSPIPEVLTLRDPDAGFPMAASTLLPFSCRQPEATGWRCKRRSAVAHPLFPSSKLSPRYPACAHGHPQQLSQCTCHGCFLHRISGVPPQFPEPWQTTKKWVSAGDTLQTELPIKELRFLQPWRSEFKSDISTIQLPTYKRGCSSDKHMNPQYPSTSLGGLSTWHMTWHPPRSIQALGALDIATLRQGDHHPGRSRRQILDLQGWKSWQFIVESEDGYQLSKVLKPVSAAWRFEIQLKNSNEIPSFPEHFMWKVANHTHKNPSPHRCLDHVLRVRTSSGPVKMRRKACRP